MAPRLILTALARTLRPDASLRRRVDAAVRRPSRARGRAAGGDPLATSVVAEEREQGASVLFPVSAGARPVEAFGRYLQQLVEADIPGDTGALGQIVAEDVALQVVEPGPRPLVGIVCSTPEQLGLGAGELCGLRWAIGQLRAFGCEPLLIPPRLDLALSSNPRKRLRQLAAITGRLDGVLGLGGWDIDPGLYGERNRHSVNVHPARDRSELEFALAAMDAELYMFGICRSHQLWNVARGGTLIQDIQAEGYASVPHDTRAHGLEAHHPLVVPCARGGAPFEHRVRLRSGSRTARIVKNAVSLLTNARHHQAVRSPGWGLEPVGVVSDHGTGKDLIEVTEGERMVTVQFHPEDMPEDEHAKALLHAFARRSHVFRMLRTLRSEGHVPSIPELERRMDASKVPFEASDAHWVRTDVARLLLRSARAERPGASGRWM